MDRGINSQFYADCFADTQRRRGTKCFPGVSLVDPSCSFCLGNADSNCPVKPGSAGRVCY